MLTCPSKLAVYPAGPVKSAYIWFLTLFIILHSWDGSQPYGGTQRHFAAMQDFGQVLNLAFSTMLVLYGTVAACGYYYWGRNAHELVTSDLEVNSPWSGVSVIAPGLTLDRLVSGCILVNAATTYPSLLMVIQVLFPPYSCSEMGSMSETQSTVGSR